MKNVDTLDLNSFSPEELAALRAQTALAPEETLQWLGWKPKRIWNYTWAVSIPGDTNWWKIEKLMSKLGFAEVTDYANSWIELEGSVVVRFTAVTIASRQ